jgi:hypothetical protein
MDTLLMIQMSMIQMAKVIRPESENKKKMITTISRKEVELRQDKEMIVKLVAVHWPMKMMKLIT